MFKSTAIVTLLSIGVSIVTFVNQLILARYFGAGLQMDLYLAISSIPLMISGIMGAALSYALTPHLILEKAVLKEIFTPYVSKLFSRIIKLSFLISFLGCIFILLAKNLIYPPQISKTMEATWITILSWITAFFTIPIALMTCYAYSVNRFKAPLLISLLPYVFSILFTATTHRFLGIISVSLGLLVGYLVGLLLFIIAFKKEALFSKNQQAIKEGFNKKTLAFLKHMPVIMLAMLCFSIYQTIDAYWAAKLGHASISYLGYSQRIIVALGTLVIIGPSTVLIPRLSKAIAENRHADFYADTLTVIKMIISIASLFALIGGLCAPLIIEIMFERGAFTQIDTRQVATLLPYMLTGMVFMVSVVMMYRSFFVLKKINTVAWFGLICVILYFVSSGVASKLIGLRGICIAYIITWVSIFILSITSLFKNNRHYIFDLKNLRFIGNQVLLLALTACVVYFVKQFCISWFETWKGLTRSLVILILSSGFGVITYVILALSVLHQPEFSFLIKGFIGKRLPITSSSAQEQVL